MQPDQRRLAAERADHQRDMLLRRRRCRGRRRSGVSGRPSSGSLRAGDQRDLGARRRRSSSIDTADRAVGRRIDAATAPAAARPAAPASAPRAASASSIERHRLERAERRARQSRPGSASASAASASSQAARAISTGRAGSAASRSLASDKAAARAPLISKRRRAVRIEQREQLAASPSRPRATAVAVDPSPAARPRARRSRGRWPRRRSNRELRRSAAHGRTAASQARHGSSTRCAASCAASSGDAHIWSSRRPRSFLVQSGER